LRLEGHEVHVAHSGVAALGKVEKDCPEAIFMDIGMPGMNGYEVAERLRELPGMDRVLVVALTGYGQEADRRRSEKAGFDCHIVKPVEAKDIKALLAHPKFHDQESEPEQSGDVMK